MKEGGGRSCLGEQSGCGLEVSSFERGLAQLGTAHTYHSTHLLCLPVPGLSSPSPSSHDLILPFTVVLGSSLCPGSSLRLLSSRLQLLPGSTSNPRRAVGILPPTFDSELTPNWLEGFSALHSVMTAQRQSRPGNRPLPGPPWLVHPPWLRKLRRLLLRALAGLSVKTLRQENLLGS